MESSFKNLLSKLHQYINKPFNNQKSSKFLRSIKIHDYSKKVFILIALLPIIIFLWAILKYSINMPSWDDYDAILNWINRFILYHDNLKYVISMLLEQHNDHRILFDRVFILLDYYLFGSINFVYLSFVGYLGLFAIFGLLLWLGVKNGLNNIELLPIPFFIFTLSQYELITFAMASMQQYWQLLFCLVAILFVSQNIKTKTYHIIFSFLFAAVASFTGAGGLIVFPVILIYLTLYKKDIKNSIIWLLGMTLIFFVYFIILKYQQPLGDIEGQKYAIDNLLIYLEYIFYFLGGIVGNDIKSLLFGSLLFLSALFLGIRFYKKNQTLILFFFFISSSAAVTGLFRVSLGVTEATSSRYTIYSAVLLVSLYIMSMSQIKSIVYRHFALIISLTISVFLFSYWIPNGIASLKNQNNLLESNLQNSSEQRAIDILETSMKLGVFVPSAQTYKYLPSYYAIDNKLNQSTLYNIESVSLNNNKPLYGIVYSTKTSDSGNIPLQLNNNNQSMQIILPDGLPKGAINSVSVFQGNYFNTANGVFKLKICNNNKCSSGERPLMQSVDNSFFDVLLNKPIRITSGRVLIDLLYTDSTKPEAIWLWPSLSDCPQVIKVANEEIPNKSVRFRFNYANQNKIQFTINKNNKDFLQIAGWAVDSVAKNSDSGVFAVIDNRYFYPLQSGLLRSDVSKALSNPNYENSGFIGKLPIGNLNPGAHTIILRILNNQDTGYFETMPIEFNIL